MTQAAVLERQLQSSHEPVKGIVVIRIGKLTPCRTVLRKHDAMGSLGGIEGQFAAFRDK